MSSQPFRAAGLHAGGVKEISPRCASVASHRGLVNREKRTPEACEEKLAVQQQARPGGAIDRLLDLPESTLPLPIALYRAGENPYNEHVCHEKRELNDGKAEEQLIDFHGKIDRA